MEGGNTQRRELRHSEWSSLSWQFFRRRLIQRIEEPFLVWTCQSACFGWFQAARRGRPRVRSGHWFPSSAAGLASGDITYFLASLAKIRP